MNEELILLLRTKLSAIIAENSSDNVHAWLVSCQEELKGKIHWRLVGKENIINIIDFFIAEIETILEKKNNSTFVKKKCLQIMMRIDELKENNFSLYHGMGDRKLNLLRIQHVLVAGSGKKHEPFWFTMNRNEARIHAEIAAGEDYMFDELERLSPGSGEFVFSKGPDEVWAEAEEHGEFHSISKEEIERIMDESEKRKGWIVTLCYPNNFILQHYTKEAEEGAYTITTNDGIIDESQILVESA
ncbi:hypothetical protein HY483_00580 [Candidatus Woesearchaeota archaeon]|nr:hypothetical protein [Candidatus Woesearchaeota archaeon]